MAQIQEAIDLVVGFARQPVVQYVMLAFALFGAVWAIAQYQESAQAQAAPTAKKTYAEAVKAAPSAAAEGKSPKPRGRPAKKAASPSPAKAVVSKSPAPRGRKPAAKAASPSPAAKPRGRKPSKSATKRK